MASASKDAYKKSFFHQTIMDWNDLLDSLITAAELSDEVLRIFINLGTNLPPPSPGEVLSFSRFTINYSDSNPDHKQSNKVGLSEKNHTHILLLQPKQTRSR